MTDDPYKAPAVETETPSRSSPASSIAVVLWCCVGLAGASLMWATWDSYRHGAQQEVGVMEILLAFCALLISVIGLTFHWGSMIPCTIFGFLLGTVILATNSPLLDVVEWAIVAAVLGALVGWFIDSIRPKSKQAE